MSGSSSKKGLELPKVDTSLAITDIVKDETIPNPAAAPRMIRILPTQAQTGFRGANSEGAVSETASVSGMSSRPVSPPLQSQQQPQKKSKSALKRERRKDAEEKERELQQERLKEVEEVHAPITGRMKKKDKKRADGSIESLPSPHLSEKIDPPQISVPEKRDMPINSISGVAASPTQTEKPPTSNKTVAQLLQEINGIHFAALEMFKPIVGIRYELHITADELAQIKVRDDTITKPEPQGQQLQHSGTTGINLRGGGTITMHQLVTPGGNVLTGLTQQQEENFLKLEESRKREKAWERYPTTMKEWKWIPKNTSLLEENREDEGKVNLEELKEKVIAARKETEAFEKKLEKLLKRNKKLVGLA